MGFRADLRTAAVELVTDYAQSQSLKLQTYRARPRSINPPTAFVDVVREGITSVGHLQQRRPQVDVLIVHGLYDGGEAVDQADAFVDGFVDWVQSNVHAAGATTLVEAVEVEDVPTFVPDWMAPELQRTYFATRITLEGYAEN